MNNIKSYKDGDRLILVIENCTGDTAAKVNAFVADILGINEDFPAPKEIEGVEPIVTAEIKMPDISKAKAIETIEDFFPVSQNKDIYSFSLPDEMYPLSVAISSMDIKYISKILIYCEANDFPEKEKVESICKQTLRDDCSIRVYDDSMDRIDKFFEDYSDIITKEVKAICEATGNSDYQNFRINETEETIRDAYEAISKKLSKL